MDKKETVKILSIIEAAYPNFKVNNAGAMFEAWHLILADYPYKMIEGALKAYITTSGSAFAPSVSELISYTKQESTELNELEAWTGVRKAISRATYYSEEEFDKLPALTQKVVGSPEQLRNWATSSIDAIETVVASNFQRTYRAVAKREERNIAMAGIGMNKQEALEG